MANALPLNFLNSLRSVKGFNEEALIKAHENDKLPVSVRLNPNKRTELKFELDGSVPWTSDAYYLKDRPVFTADPLFHAGCYYVQEASSMFVEHVLKQTVDLSSDLFALDLCAAPGGKTTILSSLLSKESVLVANEVIKNRADILSYNLAKWGNCNHIVTNSETSSFSGINGLFDVVLIDAPCSGSGLFRKQPDAINEWNEEAVLKCGDRQQKILTDILPSLKTNGVLVYSTCSYSVQENEEIVKWMLDNNDVELVQIKMDAAWGIEDTGLGYRFYPYNLHGEGFFCAVFRVLDYRSEFHLKQKGNLKEATKGEMEIIHPFLNIDFEHKVINHQGDYKLLNTKILQLLNALKSTLYLKQVGTSLGEIKQADLIPHHFLALSNYTNTGIERIELNDNEAIKFLKKENFDHSHSTTGLKLITHKNFGIGWAKVLNNRANNYLPQNYMIINKEIGL